MKRISLLLILPAIILSTAFNAAAPLPKVLLMDAGRLEALKTKVKTKDKKTLDLVSDLQKIADKLLDMKPVSVMDKAFTPKSGNKHDYMSQAPYFWYDSSKPNGLPYMRKDGQRNPEIQKITDRTFIGDLDQATRTLSLAWYLTGEEKYAEKAAVLLRTWFINESTKMNPNLDFGQAIPGVNDGRGIGIIETIALTGITDAVGLLEGSKSWTKADDNQLHQWYAQYLNWMLTSKNGNEEHAAKNNHGTWYYVQVVDFALFTGNKTKAIELLGESKNRLDSQLDKEGKMPLELERTNGLGYSTFNLQAWFRLAKLAELAGIDIWNYSTPAGVSIRTALDWLTPYALGKKQWTYDQIGDYNTNSIYTLLMQAGDKYRDKKYTELAGQLEKKDSDVMTTLLYKN